MRSVGNSLVYWLNEEHFLVREIVRPAFEKEQGVFDYVTRIVLKEIKPPKPLSIILFGSFAKGDASADSDIDIVLVYPNRKNKTFIMKELSEAEKKITLLFGNHLAAVPLRIGEFQKKLKEKDKSTNEIIKTGKVIYGKNIAELVSFR